MVPAEPPRKREIRLFVYGTLLAGQRNHPPLAQGKALGPITTAPSFQLVDLGSEAALIAGGSVAVRGELYLVEITTLAAIDVLMQVPLLFRRERVVLADGSEAQAHLLTQDQVRGRRRLASGDWCNPRGAPGGLRPAGPFVSWSRKRFG